MGRTRATQGANAQFTYDFGIAVAQGTVSKLTRLTGATLTLASAFYALKTAAAEYVDTLRENTLRFGGVLSTLKAMEQAQNRLIKGQSFFDVSDQMAGMNKLMSMGVRVKENFDWLNKAAHATGKSMAQFSDVIAQGISGNMQGLVDMGLMTQRATRMFDKYQGNTIMRQQAILNFVKNHKGLMNAIKNDFETIQDQMTRLKGIWKSFLQSVLGKPNDPNSFYGQIVSSMKMVATALSRNMEQIKRYGYVIGQVLGWVIKQIGHFIVWVGRQAKNTLDSIWKITDNFKDQTRSVLVWLEFWKLRVVDFFKEYGGEIKTLLKLLLLYKALKWVFVISKAAILSAHAYNAALFGPFGLFAKMGKIRRMIGTSWWKSFWLAITPRWVIKVITKITPFFTYTLPMALKASWKWLTKIGGAMSGTFLGRIVTVGSKFAGWAGAIYGVWEALKWGGKYFKPLQRFTDEIGDRITSMKNTYVNMFYDAYDALRFSWKPFKDWWKKNVSGPISKSFLEAGWGEWFDKIKTKAKNAIEYIGKKFADIILYPFEKTFGWIKPLIQNYQRTSQMKSMRERLEQAKVDKAQVDYIIAQRQKAVDLGLKPRPMIFPTAVQRRVDEMNENKKVNPVVNSNSTIPVTNRGSNGFTPSWKKSTPDTPVVSPVVTPNSTIPLANWGSTGLTPAWQKSTPDTPVVNPIVRAKSKSTTPKPSKTKETEEYSSDITMSPGAVQIIVQKGDHIDEVKLAQKIREVISDMQRGSKIRGGE